MNTEMISQTVFNNPDLAKHNQINVFNRYGIDNRQVARLSYLKRAENSLPVWNYKPSDEVLKILNDLLTDAKMLEVKRLIDNEQVSYARKYGINPWYRCRDIRKLAKDKYPEQYMKDSSFNTDMCNRFSWNTKTQTKYGFLFKK